MDSLTVQDMRNAQVINRQVNDKSSKHIYQVPSRSLHQDPITEDTNE